MATAAVPHRSAIAEMESRDARIWCFLVVFEMIAAAAKGHASGIINPKPPARQIERVDPIVAKFAVAPMPAPMPIVMNEVVDVRTFRGRSLPERIIQIGRNGDLF